MTRFSVNGALVLIASLAVGCRGPTEPARRFLTPPPDSAVPTGSVSDSVVLKVLSPKLTGDQVHVPSHSSGNRVLFRVATRQHQQLRLQCRPEPPVTACAAQRAEPTAPGDTVDVAVTYSTDAPGSGRVWLHASVEGATAADSASVLTNSVAWPNHPASFSTLTDWRFDSLSGPGWLLRGPGPELVRDSGAPLSPPGLVRFTYPQGHQGGLGNVIGGLGVPRTEMYFGYWWKPSDPWQGHNTAANKISHLASNSADNKVIVVMDGAGLGPFRLAIHLTSRDADNCHLGNIKVAGIPADCSDTRIYGNVDGGNYPVVPGRWYRVEVYAKMSRTPASRDGILRWWVQAAGQQLMAVGDYRDVNFNSDPFVELRIDPTWGGVGDTKRQEDYFWFDHVLISAPAPSAP